MKEGRGEKGRKGREGEERGSCGPQIQLMDPPVPSQARRTSAGSAASAPDRSRAPPGRRGAARRLRRVWSETIRMLLGLSIIGGRRYRPWPRTRRAESDGSDRTFFNERNERYIGNDRAKSFKSKAGYCHVLSLSLSLCVCVCVWLPPVGRHWID